MIDDSFNKKQYEKHLQYYLNSNTNGQVGGGDPQKRVSLLQRYLPSGRKIFEIGSGGGGDVVALQKAGYKVTASDYSEKFIEILKNKNLEAILFDAKTEELPDIDAVYANAVFVHFSTEELKTFLKKAKKKLHHEKIIFLSVIQGKGQERRPSKSGFERDFQYYTREIILKILKQTDYVIKYSDLVDEKWIQVIAQAEY